MNTLSWLIYLAEVVGNLGKNLEIVFTVTLVVSVLLAVAALICMGASIEVDDDDLRKVAKRIGKWAIGLTVTTFFFITLSSLIPSSKTVYAIAASEMGEVVVKSEEAQEVFKALKDRVMDELKIEEKKED